MQLQQCLDTSSQPISPEIEATQIANGLARYGYATESASALIEAAEILSQIQTQALSASGKKEESSSVSVSSPDAKPEFTTARLLEDARKFAAGDQTMLAWANDLEASLKIAKRGAAGGPKWVTDFVNGGGSTVSYSINFRANQLAEVQVLGDGSTDLDLYIIDQNGNIIAADESYDVDCYVRWVPAWTGPFTVIVKNQGRYRNSYVIETN
jgi:hypothetical protein